MRWLSFILLAGVALAAQTTLARSLELLGATPDFMLVLTVHYALHARSAEGWVAGWMAGLVVDLASVERLGIAALAYGAVAVIIWTIRDLVFVRHPLTHFSVTVFFGVVVNVALRGYHVVAHDAAATLPGLLAVSLLSAVYTGLWAVLVHGLLLKCSRLLGLGRAQGRPRYGVRLV